MVAQGGDGEREGDTCIVVERGFGDRRGLKDGHWAPRSAPKTGGKLRDTVIVGLR